MDARDYFLDLHEAIHATGYAHMTLDQAMTPYYRTVLPDHNSVAWLLWHITRGEDWAVQTMLHGREQLLTRDGWGNRMGVTYPGFGGGMHRDKMIELSDHIDLDALRGYYHAVTDATRGAMRTYNFDVLHQPFDVHARLALAPETLGPSPFMQQMLPRWATPWTWVEVFTIVDVAMHFAEADHILDLVVPDREFV